MCAPDGLRDADQVPITVLAEGTSVKGYRMQFLAAGGMSVAYRARRNADGRTYFAKEVSLQVPASVMALTQEKTLLERLHHPAIVKVFELFEWEGYLYLITEFVEGGNLQEQVSPFADIFLPVSEVVGWAVQLCEIFEYLHSQNPPVIYRDLKPKNVLRTPEGRLYLVDFGIARAFKEGKEQDTRLLGSVLTASPEHYGGQTDMRSDLYTLGATVHYLLSNGQGARSSPFDFPPLSSLRPDVPAELEAIVRRCLERAPEQRFQSALELKRALLGEALPAPALAPAPAPVGPPVAVASSRPSWLPAALGLAAGILLTLALTGRRQATVVAPGPAPTVVAASSPVALVKPPTPAAVVTPSPLPVPVEKTPAPTPLAVSLPPPRPTPTPAPAPAPAPVVVPQLPSDPYPQRTAAVSASSDSAEQILEQLGRPWESAWNPRRWGLHRQDWLDGPNGLWRCRVPEGFSVGGDPGEWVLVHWKRQSSGIIRIRTLEGQSCDLQQLIQARRLQAGANLVEGSGPSLTYQIEGKRRELEEVLWTQSQPAWTVSLAATGWRNQRQELHQELLTLAEQIGR